VRESKKETDRERERDVGRVCAAGEREKERLIENEIDDEID
jgi:hypothetical protein